MARGMFGHYGSYVNIAILSAMASMMVDDIDYIVDYMAYYGCLKKHLDLKDEAHDSDFVKDINL